MNARRILIVDDEPLIAMMLSDWLGELGHAVVGPALTAADALSLIDDNEIDGAILDVTLGDGTSYGLAEVLQQRTVPLIFATGHRSEGIDPRFRGAPTLQKPFDLASLRRAVELLPALA